jgi:hypothetical protein
MRTIAERLILVTASVFVAPSSQEIHNQYGEPDQERFTGEFAFDRFSITNCVNVSDLNTVCECDLPAADFSTAALPSTIASLNPPFGFDTPRQRLNRFQFQYGFKLNF